MTISIQSIEDVANVIKLMSTADLRELVAYLSSDGTTVRRCTMHAMCYIYDTPQAKQSADIRAQVN